MAVSSFDPFHLRFESLIEAQPSGTHRLVGFSSEAALSLLLSNSLNPAIRGRRNLVVFPTASVSVGFVRDFEFFVPKLSVPGQVTPHFLPEWDASPYSGVFPNARRMSERVGFLDACLSKASGVFVASVRALMQRTIPKNILSQKILHLEAGVKLPEDFAKILGGCGYVAAPIVEDVGAFSLRGGILDIFPPSLLKPVRVELFGNTVESLREYDPRTQRTETPLSSARIVPAREIVLDDDVSTRLMDRLRSSGRKTEGASLHLHDAFRALSSRTFFHGIDFLVPFAYKNPGSITDYLGDKWNIWIFDPLSCLKQGELFSSELSKDFEALETLWTPPAPSEISLPFDQISWPKGGTLFELSRIDVQDLEKRLHSAPVEYGATPLLPPAGPKDSLRLVKAVQKYLTASESHVFIAAGTTAASARAKHLLSSHDIGAQVVSPDDFRWESLRQDSESRVTIIPRELSSSFSIASESLAFLSNDEFLGKKRLIAASHDASDLAPSMGTSLSDLKSGDYIVHVDHGVGVYEGLQRISIAGQASEFAQLSYKDGDRLFLPVYRIGLIQKYASADKNLPLDKLGGTAWHKTKTKVRHQLRDVSAQLLDLYAQRASIHRPVLTALDGDFEKMTSEFPFSETPDQMKAINDVLGDLLEKSHPMDRLVCGDVGFGKTEVAIRAAFKVFQSGRQVAVLVPTTTLAFQHLETFNRRLAAWPIKIAGLSRFTSPADTRKVLDGLAKGEVDIVIGTHRLLSKDVSFKSLGFLVVDEEHRFGVVHKERIRKFRAEVDTLSLSATPIPRTLNMGLNGIRDLTLMSTPPQDRLPIKTFISRWDDRLIADAIRSELARDGQVFFIHNRIDTLPQVASELRALVPEAKIVLGHGQMPERELETVFLGFMKNEFNVLLSTTIVESGIDIPRANTMLIDRADTFGLSQLYQLRGRVGRSSERAYCYLFLPRTGSIDAAGQERLKILQENSALGSGIRVAHYDLELRGAGNLLGEEQSGLAATVGYELYMELLKEALDEARTGKPQAPYQEPEINLRIPAYFPEDYMPDVRLRFSYYKSLTTIQSPVDADKVEEDLRDRFGPLPIEAVNLLGVMMIRRLCIELGIRDLSVGTKNFSIQFVEQTPFGPHALNFVKTDPKKFQLTPGNGLVVKNANLGWPSILEELNSIKRFTA